MDTQQYMEDRLWDYIDGNCSAEEKALVEELLKINSGWQSRYNELLELNQSVYANIEPDQPSMRFTKNVMDEIEKSHIAPAAHSYINKKIVYGIAGFFILIISGFLVYGFTQVDWHAAGNISFTINVSKYINSTFLNIFMLFNILLALAFLDRYLRKKKQHIRKDSKIG